MNPCKEIFSLWERDLVGYMLGTGTNMFQAEVIDGLARMRDGGIEFLVVHADKPRCGSLRKLIDDCKKQFNCVRILLVWNDALEAALKRYGFKEFQFNEGDEIVAGWEWRKVVQA